MAIAILGLLASLLLPAVSRSRESARRVTCLANLSQIGVAIHSYEATHGVFPANQCYIRLMPHLGLSPLYAEIMASHPGRPAAPSEPVAVFRCPSDFPPAPVRPSITVSYWMSGGSGFLVRNSVEPWVTWETEDYNGLNGFGNTYAGSTRPADYTDGLSTTLAFTERLLVGHWNYHRMTYNDPRRHFWDTPQPLRARAQLDAFADQCLTSATLPSYPGGDGYEQNSLYGHGTINHIMTPNQKSCWNNSEADWGPFYAAWTASSEHPGGVHGLLVDGSARFIGNHIDRAIWRGFGTRNGGEISGTF